MQTHPIGIFDSGYGGLTIYEKIKAKMPQYDYIYLGDNARTPYGPRSFEVVYQFTRQAVSYLFDQGCPLVILACNTASAKALRTIQQQDLLLWGNTHRRVLGVIRPTVEIVDELSKTKHIGIFGTKGTIASASYEIEIQKYHPHITVVGEACPMWVPIVENNESRSAGADYFVKKHIDSLLSKDPLIDTIILACTHYPLLQQKIEQYLPPTVKLFAQGERIADSLQDYFLRHREMETALSKGGNTQFLTTESAESFTASASLFLPCIVEAKRITL